MIRDKDGDLIKRMNRVLTEDIERSLRQVLGVQLKPIIVRMDSFESKMNSLEARMGVLERELKKQGRNIKRLGNTLDVAIKTFDYGDVKLHKRVGRIEEHLGLTKT